MAEDPTPGDAGKVPTGVPGLDAVLEGGFPPEQMHLLVGPPGAGKTTFALQFLIEGAARGERVLYVTLAESAAELHQVARSHDWSLDGVTVREFTPSEEQLNEEQRYTVLYPGEVEFSETMDAILKEVEETRPARVVFDSLVELRLLARDNVRYRQQILALKHFFAGLHCTVLLLDNSQSREQSLESVAHSVTVLEYRVPEYGNVRRRLQVSKLRGSTYHSGYHDMEILTGGILVYPRLVAAEHRDQVEVPRDQMSSGLPELDRLLGGGPALGTSMLLMGPAGSGKSSLAAQYAAAAAQRGQRSVFYIFEELRETFLQRAEGLGIPMQQAADDGLVAIEQLDPAQISPGAFIQRVRDAVERDGAQVVVIDSINGYLNAMSEEQMVVVQLHELLTYLGQSGVLSILTLAQHGMVGEHMQPPMDVSYLTDTVVLVRYFEAFGEVRQAISVVKKRSGTHERSIRELRIGSGLHVGEILRDFEGVMTGTPRFLGDRSTLLDRNDQ